MENPKDTKGSAAENSDSKEDSSNKSDSKEAKDEAACEGEESKGKTKDASKKSEEDSLKKSSESRESKEEAASGEEESKETTKDASTKQSSTDSFSGSEETGNITPIRSTREASRNATAILTKKSSSRAEKTEGKSDSPPDLVLFLKEGRGRAQAYSEPPRLDPESIATRRRTRVPEDPVALISKTRTSEKTKKDQKGSTKKERKTKVMDTPESLKRLAREGGRQTHVMSKESSDSGSEERTPKKVSSKGVIEDDGKKTIGTPTKPGEEAPANISKRSSRGKRNSTDELEPEMAGSRPASPSNDSADDSMNYSNLGSILNKMSRNVADKRIPVVIMSKSEKEAKNDPAKPKSKKKAPDKNSNTAVLKIAAPTIPASPAEAEDEDAPLLKSEDECKTPTQEDDRSMSCTSIDTIDSDSDDDVIVLETTSDERTSIKKATGNGSPDESQVKQNTISVNKEQAKSESESSKAPGTTEAVISGPQPDAFKAAEGSATPPKLTSSKSGTSIIPLRSPVVTPVKPSPSTIPKSFPLPIITTFGPHGKANSVTLPVTINPRVPPAKPSPSTSLKSMASHMKSSSFMPPIVRSSSVGSLVKLSRSTSPIRSNQVMSRVKPTPGTSQIKPSPPVLHTKPGQVTAHIQTSPIVLRHTQINPNSTSSPTKSNVLVSHVKTSPLSLPIKSSSVLPRVKPSPFASLKSSLVMSQAKTSPGPSLRSLLVTASNRSASATSPFTDSGISGLKGQNVPSGVVSTSRAVSYGNVKGSMKMSNLEPNKMRLKMSNTKVTSTTQTPRQILPKQESSSSVPKVMLSAGRNKFVGFQGSAEEASSSLAQKGPLLDYTDIETEEVVLGENEDSNGQTDKVGDMPEGVDLLAHEELESSSDEESVRIPDQPVTKKESLSPEGRVALDHSYSSGGSGVPRKKSPTTYEKSLTPRPVYSNASPVKRSMDIMLHNDKINILRQMSQIFNDEKPLQKTLSDEKGSQPDTDNDISLSGGSDWEDEEADTVTKNSEESIATKFSSKLSKVTTDAAEKVGSTNKMTSSTNSCEGNTSEPSSSIQGDTLSEATSSHSLPVELSKSSEAFTTLSEASSHSESTSTSPEKSSDMTVASEQIERKEMSAGSSPLGFPDSDPKVHHVPAYSVLLDEKISVQSKVGPAGEIIDIVDDFTFMSFSTEKEMMSYDGTYSGTTTKTHRQWLKKKRRKRKKLVRLKGMRKAYQKRLQEAATSSLAVCAASPREKGATAECGAFASDDLDTFLDKNSRLNISYQIPKCKATEDGVTRVDEEEFLEPTPPSQAQTRPQSPPSPEAPLSPPGSPRSSLLEVMPSRTPTTTPVNTNTGTLEHETESVPQYEEVNAIDILYPKEKYKYYYNKELCKETKADGANVFVRRAGKLVPLTTIFKSQKSPSVEQPSTSINESVELIYVYDGGKLLTLGGSLTKINPSNSHCVRAKVLLPRGVPPIPKGETVAARSKKVQAVEINEDMAKFALSALQSYPPKPEQDTDTKIESDELPPLPGPSSDGGNDEKMDVDTLPAAPLDNTKAKDAPKTVPNTLPTLPKPNKTNILDIIAAKLAMSDDESDEKEEDDEKAGTSCEKQLKKAASMDSTQTTKHVAKEGKEESKTEIKEEDKDADMDQESIGTSESKPPPLKQEDLREEKLKEEPAAKLEATVQEDIKSETGVEEVVTPGTEDTPRSLGREESEEKDEPDIVKKSREVIDLEDLEKNDISSDMEENVKEAVKAKEGHQKDSMSLVSEERSVSKERTSERSEEIMLDEKAEITPSSPERQGKESKVPEEKDNDKDEERNPLIDEEKKNDVLEESDKQGITEAENINTTNSVKEQSVNLKGQEEESTESHVETSTLMEQGKTETESPMEVDTDIVNPPTGTCSEEDVENTHSNSNPAESVSEPVTDTSGVTSQSTSLPSSQESEDKTDVEEKSGDPLEGIGLDALRMDTKSKVFKRNIYRFPSLSREMKRLNMNFVSYEPPPLEDVEEEEEEETQKVKEECDNEHCKLGCVCDSLLCQRRSVEHCGRVECMFECTCRDESWKLPSGSGKTMNAVSIFNLDREQKEGLALREKDFKRTVIQTDSEVILVGAERKKREIRLPGRYRGTTVWGAPEFSDVTTYFEQPELSLQPDYPGIPLSEASKYIKNFKLSIPWFDIKGISVWCMDHSCYDCRCLTDPSFGDPIQGVSRKIRSTKTNIPVKSSEPLSSTHHTLLDFDETLIQKPPEELEHKVPVAEASCSIMNIIVNNSEARRKYTWKLKEWYHHTEYFCARTAGYSKSRTTEETKNMTLTGLAAKDTTPEQIVESVVRSLRQQKTNDDLKLPSLSCGNNFEPFMGDSLTELQNAIGLDSEKVKQHTRDESPCTLVDLTNSNEDVFPAVKPKAKLERVSHSVVARPPKDLKGVIKRRSSGRPEPPPKKVRICKSEEQAQVVQSGSSTQPSSMGSYPAHPSELRVPRKTLSLLEMMIDEENRGELELDLSHNIPGNAMLVAEARFRKLINMNIIGVIGINKAGRCIIGTVDSDEALQVMHQIQNMIRNNTLDVGPNMREIFFPPPYSGIRPRYVMIRCDSHHKWEIVGVVQKKGPIRSPNKASEFKIKAPPTKPQVPQVIDLEEEEMQKQEAGQSSDFKQEDNADIIEPASPDEKEGGAWEGSLPMIASVHSALDSNMAELIGSPETAEEPEELPSAEELSANAMNTSSVSKTLPDLVPISTPPLSTPPLIKDGEECLSLGSKNSSQKVYFLPTSLTIPSTTLTTTSSNSTDTPMKSVTLNVASNKAFGDPEKTPLLSRSLGGSKKISYLLPRLPGSSKSDTNTVIVTKSTTEGHDTNNGQSVAAPTSTSSKTLYIPVTSSCVSKVLFVPSVSSGTSQRMMLLPSLSGTSSLDTSSSTSTPSSVSTATITTSKMKMVLVPSPQDNSKMLLIPASPSCSDAATATSSKGNILAEKEKKKMLVLTPSIINSLVSRAPSSDAASTPPFQQSCKGTLLVPLPNMGVMPPKPKHSEAETDSQTQQDSSGLQDKSTELVVLDPSTSSLPVSGTMTSSESKGEQEEMPATFISPAPVASISRVAETNVVSSLTTISSTMPEKDSSTKIESDPEAVLQDKEPPRADALNTLLSKSHEEMVTETKADKEGWTEESVTGAECTKEEKVSSEAKLLVCSQNSDTIKKEDVQDQKKQLLIKKGGFHWSAVDLSINFKSVKLEWLLGTIRKNVLMNIYRMSKKTQSPVTLSVKNGTSTSMLYGFARHSRTSNLPVLILGSVVSAVLSSSSVPDSMLFQISSIKYFIREITGELSSYTYCSETHFVKLASKKRGNEGEMLGVGEQVEIKKMRDLAYQSFSVKSDHEKGKTSGSYSSVAVNCSCIEAGHLTCKGYCAAGASSSCGEGTSSQDSSKYFSSREDESQNASLGLQESSWVHVHPKEEHGSHGSLKQSSLQKLLVGSTVLRKPRPMSKMKKKVVGGEKARIEGQIQAYSVYNDQSGVREGRSINPEVKCESEEEAGDVDILGDYEAAPSILRDLRRQLENETNEVHKLVYSHTSSGEVPKRKGKRVQSDALSISRPVKKMKIGGSSSGVEQPCPRSRKPSVLSKMAKAGFMGTMTSSSEEGQRKEATDPLSRWPSHLAHLQPFAGGDVSGADEEDISDDIVLSKDKMSLLNAKRSMLYAAINHPRRSEERNTTLHNKLERMRRRVMRQLFDHLQKIIASIPGNPLLNSIPNHAKKTILNAGQRVCEILKQDERRLTLEEHMVRSERSSLIKRLAAIIGESTEEIKIKWRKWVRENMQNPTAKHIFETTWQPFCLEKDILKNVLEENFDLDNDGGSPLPEGSPAVGSSSSPSQSSGLSVPSGPSSGRKMKRPPGRRTMKKRGRKVGRPHKVQQGPGSQGAVDTPIPTSILLMAGTSSRGRKIVRKEDMNFVT